MFARIKNKQYLCALYWSSAQKSVCLPDFSGMKMIIYII